MRLSPKACPDPSSKMSVLSLRISDKESRQLIKKCVNELLQRLYWRSSLLSSLLH